MTDLTAVGPERTGWVGAAVAPQDSGRPNVAREGENRDVQTRHLSAVSYQRAWEGAKWETPHMGTTVRVYRCRTACSGRWRPYLWAYSANFASGLPWCHMLVFAYFCSGLIRFHDKCLFLSLCFLQPIVYEGQDKNPEMCRVLLTHEIMCRWGRSDTHTQA